MTGEQCTDDLRDMILKRAAAQRALAETSRQEARKRAREAWEWEALGRVLRQVDTSAIAPLRPVGPRRRIT